MNFKFLPYVTYDIGVTEENAPLEFCPTVELGTYNIYQGWVEATQYAHSLPYDRHIIKSYIAKSDYQTAINAAGIGGTLMTNLVACYAVETMGYPAGVPVGTPIYLTPIWDTNGVTFYHEFRPLPNWTTKWITIVFLMDHNGQDDYLVTPVSVTMAPYSNLINGLTPIVSPGANNVYQTGVLTDQLCTSGDVEIIFETSGFSGVLTVIHERDGQFAGEWNRYDSQQSAYFPTKLDSPILDVKLTSGLTDTWTTKLDEANIQGGDCFYYLFKATNGDPIACEDTFCVTIQSVINQWGFLTVNWSSTLGVDGQYSFSYAYTDSNYQSQTVEWQSTLHSGSVTEGLEIVLPQGTSLTMTVTVGTCTYTYVWSILQEEDIQFEDTYCV